MPICKGQVSPLKMGRVGCPETSVRNYHSTLRKIPQDLTPFLSGAEIKKNEMGIYGGEEGCIHGFLVGKPEQRRPLGRRRRRWEDNIEMDLQDVGWEGHCATNLRVS